MKEDNRIPATGIDVAHFGVEDVDAPPWMMITRVHRSLHSNLVLKYISHEVISRTVPERQASPGSPPPAQLSSDGLRYSKISYQTEVIAGPDSVDRLIENSSTSRYV